MAEKILVRVARNFGYIGILAGAYCGFLARDEFNFSTFQRVHELSDEYNQKLELLNLEETQIEKELKYINDQKLQALKQKKTGAQKPSQKKEQTKTQ